MSLLSGGIGIPDGAYSILQDGRVPRDLANYITQQITNIVTATGSGTGTYAWARVNAAGTIIGDSGVASASRSDVGVYLVNLDTAASASTSLGAVATPSTAAGNGGGGVTPLLAYDSYNAKLTDDDVDNQFVYDSTDNWLVLWGENTDDIWIHDKDDWAGTPTQIPINGAVLTTTPGCITMEGDGIFVSKAAGQPDVDHVSLPGGTVTSFGAGPLGNTRRVRAARQITGSLKIWMADGGTFGRYPVTIGTGTIGSSDFTYAGVDWNQPGDFKWDEDGYLWYPAVSTAMHQYSPIAGTKAVFNYPTTTPTGITLAANAGGGPLVYDRRRRFFYTILRSASADHLYLFKDWTTEVDNSGTWEWIADVGASGAAVVSIDYDYNTDVLLVATDAGRVMRYVGYPKKLIDTVTIPGTIPSHALDLSAHYDGNYAYVRTDVANSPNYIVRISYNGAEISVGDGASVLSSVLVAMATVQSASQVKVELFRSMSPIIRADGEFTVVIPTTT